MSLAKPTRLWVTGSSQHAQIEPAGMVGWLVCLVSRVGGTTTERGCGLPKRGYGCPCSTHWGPRPGSDSGARGGEGAPPAPVLSPGSGSGGARLTGCGFMKPHSRLNRAKENPERALAIIRLGVMCTTIMPAGGGGGGGGWVNWRRVY